MVTVLFWFVLFCFFLQGGLKAVAWTNAFHVILTVTGLVTLCIVGTNTAGGFDHVIEVNKDRKRMLLFE